MKIFFQRAVIGALLSSAILLNAQSLDWSRDAILFGTAENETHGLAAAILNSPNLRAICLRGDSTLCSKVSTDRGESWSASADFQCASAVKAMAMTSDRLFYYIFVGESLSNKRLLRFDAQQNNWSQARQQLIALDHTAEVEGLTLYDNQPLHLTSSLLHAVWSERSGGQLSVWHVQSSDSGNTFSVPHAVLTATIDAQNDFGVAITSCNHGNQERLFTAMAVDRAGSIPEAVILKRSDDLGFTWTNAVDVDNSYDAQRHPSAGAFDSTVFITYDRQANGSTQRDVYYCYSPNAGVNFSQPLSVANAADDEHHPQLVIPDDSRFYIFYLQNHAGSDTATVWMRIGLLARPWELGDPTPVSDPGNAYSGGGLFSANGGAGPMALWTSRFAGGDLDVSFDGAWRGAGVSRGDHPMPATISWGFCYPNPFNLQTTLNFDIARSRETSFDIFDVNGRRIEQIFLGQLNVGRHEIPLDFRNRGSGIYFVRLKDSNLPAQKITLIK